MRPVVETKSGPVEGLIEEFNEIFNLYKLLFTNNTYLRNF